MKSKANHSAAGKGEIALLFQSLPDRLALHKRDRLPAAEIHQCFLGA